MGDTPFVPAAGAPSVGGASTGATSIGGAPGFTINLSGISGSTKPKAVKSYAYIDGKKVLTTQANQMWLNLTADEQAQVRSFAVEQGMRPSQAKTAWGQLVAASSQAYAAGQLKTPWQVLQDQMGNKPTIYTNTTKENYTPEATTAAINNTYVKLVGRLATSDEVNAIITAANKQPGSTNQTTYGPSGATTVSSPDLTPEQIASQQLLTSSQYQPERQRQQNLSFATWLDTAMRGGTQATAGLANG
jgi:hypothetical protein